MDNIKNIFYELINEAKDGKVELDNEIFNIKFNTIINDDRNYFNDSKYQSLIIDNIDLFIDKLKEYIDLAAIHWLHPVLLLQSKNLESAS